MKKAFCFAIFAFLPIIVFAQIKAVTDTGDQVVLYKNGTWKYVSGSSISAVKISKNSKKFLKPETSTFLIKSQKTNAGVWINPKKWSFKKAVANAAAEFEFQLRGEDLCGMLIAEKTPIDIESLVNIAYQNAKNVAPDIEVVHKEYRNVNGIDVLEMQMKGTVQSIKFTYYGYYYSNSHGSFQLLTYTTQDQFKHFLNDSENFLNGFVIMNE